MRSGYASGWQHNHEHFRTSCGRELTTGRLTLGDTANPVSRVFVDLGDCPGCEDTHWASLTVPEARRLAACLLAEAAAAERECAHDHRWPSRAVAGEGGKRDRAHDHR